MKKRNGSVRPVAHSPSDDNQKASLRSSSGSQGSRKETKDNSLESMVTSLYLADSREPLKELLTPYDLVLAFERELMGADLPFNPLSQDQIKLLTAKETIKVKMKTKRKGLDVTKPTFNIDKSEWDILDMAKKERRILEVMNQQEDLRRFIVDSALESYPTPRLLKEYDLKGMYNNSMIVSEEESLNVELGDFETTYEDQLRMLHIENKNLEVNYYTDMLADDDHRNFVALDKEIGPIVISIQRQRKGRDGRVNANSRILIRTRNSDEWLFLPSRPHTKDILASLKKEQPNLAKIKFEQVKNEVISQELIKLESVLSFKTNLKVGVLYVKDNQKDENNMFGNKEMTPAFDEFLDFIGERIELKEWSHFSGGLDTKQNLTGTHSVYRQYEQYELMFHVSVLLPFDPSDQQQLERKRHIGNDMVCIIFLENTDSFNPSCLTTNFTYVYIIISPDLEATSKTGKTYYKMAIASRMGTRSFGPRLHYPGTFEKNEAFCQYLITKIINAERAAFEAPAFAEKMDRTKEAFLENMLNGLLKS